MRTRRSLAPRSSVTSSFCACRTSDMSRSADGTGIRCDAGRMAGLVPLIGRADVLGLLVDHLDAALRAEPNVVVLRGEAGIGKSRVTNALAAKARDAGALVAVGHCTPVSGSELAFGPFVEMLGEIAAVTTEWDDVVGDAGPVLGSFLANTEPTGSLTQPDVALARSQLFAGVGRLLQRIGERQPVVAVIEDLHWADASSLDLLTYLTRTARTQRLL